MGDRGIAARSSFFSSWTLMKLESFDAHIAIIASVFWKRLMSD
jgi:hypothetical protein